MIRVAVIGYPGAGRTTLANALAAVACVPPVRDLDDLWTALQAEESLVLDGHPRTLDELEQIEAKSGHGPGITHVLYLQADAEVRLGRIARAGISSDGPQRPHPVELKQVRTRLEKAGRLVVIDANRSRSEVLTDALRAVGLSV